MVYEQGAMDSLHAAKQALDRAIAAYAACQGFTLSLSDGPLFETLDNLDTVQAELVDFAAIAKR